MGKAFDLVLFNRTTGLKRDGGCESMGTLSIISSQFAVNLRLLLKIKSLLIKERESEME